MAAHQLLLVIRLATLEMKLVALRGGLERRYRADQPRVPAGKPDGGQWTRDGTATGRLPAGFARVAQNVSGIRKHGVDQIINRGISPAAVLDAIQNPIKIRPRPNGTTQYIGGSATVVLNAGGEIVTVWPQ
jgi:hypothetical protein